MNLSLPFLETIGLTANEARLYTLLLKLGEVPAAEIIRESGFKRATAYKSLYSLEKKGLVTQQDKNKIIHFRPEPPQKLLELAEGQYNALDRATKDIRAILPEFVSSYILAVEKPIIRSFEGIEGIQKAHMELLLEKQEILAYVAINHELDKQLDRFWKRYYTFRKKHNILAKVITPSNPAGVAYKRADVSEFRLTRLVPPEQFPLTIEKDIVGNKVGFFSQEKGKLIATIIDNKEIADAERAIFNLAWQQAEELSSRFSGGNK